MERSLVLIKPDAMHTGLGGAIISRLERQGLKAVALKMLHMDKALAERHYAVHKGKPFYDSLLAYMTSGPVLVLVLQAQGVIAMARKLMGATFGCDAEPGTIRGDFGGSRGFNLVHGSDSPESAQKEISLFFTPEEIVDYELANQHWLYGQN